MMQTPPAPTAASPYPEHDNLRGEGPRTEFSYLLGILKHNLFRDPAVTFLFKPFLGRGMAYSILKSWSGGFRGPQRAEERKEAIS